jgi:hypothetical protein
LSISGSLRLLPPLKTGRHNIAEILLKVALKHQKSNQSIMTEEIKRMYCTCIISIVSLGTNVSWVFFSGCLWMSFLSATGGWLAPRDEEGVQEFFERDRKNQKELRGKIWTYIKTFTESK